MAETAQGTWLLLRGLTREAAHWGGFVAQLQQALPQARILTLDLPGNGQLIALRSPADIAGMVVWCRAELAQRGIQGPVHLLAMSLGAMVATEWAYQAPRELAGCVLINTSFGPFSPFHHRLRPRNYVRLLRLVLGCAAPVAWEQAILEMTSNRPANLAVVLSAWTATRLQRPVRAGNALRQLLAAARYRARAQAPATPLLLLASEHDHLVDMRCSLAVAQHWGCPIRQHPWAGHDLPLDDPVWVVTQIQAWWATVASGAPRHAVRD